MSICLFTDYLRKGDSYCSGGRKKLVKWYTLDSCLVKYDQPSIKNGAFMELKKIKLKVSWLINLCELHRLIREDNLRTCIKLRFPRARLLNSLRQLDPI